MLRAVIFTPLLFLLVLFALSNKDVIELGLWPTDVKVGLPMSIALLLAMTAAFILGALLLWVSAVGARLRARRAEHTVRMLEAQVAELKARVAMPTVYASTTALPPPS